MIGNKTYGDLKSTELQIQQERLKQFIENNAWLPKLNLHALNELEEKQEGVPFNISLGGGTQGLLETVMPDYMSEPTKEFTLEKYFAGSFIGDLKSFKFYIC